MPGSPVLPLRSRSRGGASVTVVERRGAPACETSFANAGRFCPTSIANGSPAQTSSTFRSLLPDVVRGLFPLSSFDPGSPWQHHMHVRLTPSLVLWGLLSLESKTWLGKWRSSGDCYSSLSQEDQVLRAHRILAARARQAMSDLTGDGVDGHGLVSSGRNISRMDGTLWLFHNAVNLSLGLEKCNTAVGVGYTKCRKVDVASGLLEFPFLQRWKNQGAPMFPGAVYAGDDHSADARHFTLDVVDAARDLGVVFRFGHTVSCLAYDDDDDANKPKCCTGVILSSGEHLQADAVVLACASHSTKLTPSGPIRMPIEPLRGFSLDLIGVRGDQVPTVAFADYSSGDLNYQFTPFTDEKEARARVVGFADFVGLDYVEDMARVEEDAARATQILVDHTRYVLPGLEWESQTETWYGLRPMTPDNMPYVGRDRRSQNVYLCCGHGATGWTTSAATANVLAQVMFPREREGYTEEEEFLQGMMDPHRFERSPFVRTFRLFFS